ncbi:MAG TPA: Ppx/GppA phosphatase family protein [Hyphomicrobium sp.]|nr:Ppx/GppA phosphatase family protein [Hyphomicrobium sp.]
MQIEDVIGTDSPRPGLEPIGVIDIGSNSVRLVVYEGAVRSPTPLFNEKVLCGLGRSVATTGSLAPVAVERAIHALVRFKAIARLLGVKNVKAIATAAVREASNGAEFITRGEAALGLHIEVLSGEAEARLAAQGIMMGFMSPDGVAGDLGGGSLELIDVVGETLREAATLPLGGLRLIDTTGGKLDAALVAVDNAIAALSWLGRGKGRALYAVGGTWRALAKLHMDYRNHPLRVMHGYQVAPREIEEFCEALRKGKKQGLPSLEGVAKARREVLPYGALVLERLVKKMQPSSVVFSVFGIREGLIYGLLPEHERRRDPLISFAEQYATMRSRSLDHAHELCQWTDQLFADPSFEETAQERRLRHAACLLSDVGWRAHPDYRAEQSLSTIAHAALGGVDHEGRVFLALSVFFRHEVGELSPDSLPERLRALVSKRTLRRARIVGAAVRAAHMLSIGKPGIIGETPLSHENGKLILTIPKVYAGLDGERLRRRFEVLAGLVGRQPVVRIAN